MTHGHGERRTLAAKFVYYGPAGSGKTTNLEALQRIAGSRRGHSLLTVKTDKDSTLFFDLLPVDLEDILGYRIEAKLYTVPGQVRCDATRRVVLGGADAVVFVADSRPSRREQNIWSLQNLEMNMRAREMDPRKVPVLFQINRRDEPDAAPAAEIAEWLRVADRGVLPAVATRGEGVLETLKSACHASLATLLERRGADYRAQEHADELAAAIERAFAPFADRLAAGWPAVATVEPSGKPIVLSGGDLLEGAIETSVRLGEDCSNQAARVRRLAREADGFRRLGDSLCGISSAADATASIEAALAVARDVLEARAVSVVAQPGSGPLLLESLCGSGEEPLLGSSAGRRLLRRLISAEGPCVVDDLAEHCATPAEAVPTSAPRSVASVPVACDGRRLLLAYGAGPDGLFEPDDVHFLESVARHIAAGLDRAQHQDDLDRDREQLARSAAAERPDERRSRGPRRAVDRVRERLLDNLADEMRAPVAAVARAASALDACRVADSEGELIRSIVHSAELLERQVEDLSRLVRLVAAAPLELAEQSPRRLVEEAVRRSGHRGIRSDLAAAPGSATFDFEVLTRAVAGLIDNAVKFSPKGARVRVRIRPARIEASRHGEVDAMEIAVIDRGPGIPEGDRERIFAPFARTPQVASGRGGGLGIGLWEARCTARRHGGRLEHTARRGGGSVFSLTVPLEPIAEEAQMEVHLV